MANDILFEEFRARIEGRSKAPGQHDFDIRAIAETCRWVSKSGLFGGGQYCFGGKKQKDTEELLSFFATNAAVHSLGDFPEHLCDIAFCELHAAAAKPLCRDARFYFAGGTAIVKTQTGDEDKQLVLWQPSQWLRFGDDGSMHFAMGDSKEADSELHVLFDHQEREVYLKRNDTDEHTAIDNKNLSDHAQDARAAADLDEREDEQKVEDKYFSPRANLFRSSRSQDFFHPSDVAAVEQKLFKLMQKEIKVRYSTPGYVYAFRDHEIGLIKFGSTGQFLTTRLGQIQNECKPGKPLDIVAGLHWEPFRAFEVLEKLIHEYLQPHRWYFKCVHGKTKIKHVRHGEYFDITDQEACEVFRVWRNFMSLTPFECPNSPTLWSLRPKWVNRIKDIKSPPKHETHKDHLLKLGRWEKVLLDSRKDLPGLGKLSGIHDTAVGSTNTAEKLPFADTESTKRGRSQRGRKAPNPFSSRVKDDLIANLTPTRFSLDVPETLLTRSRSAPSTPMLRGIDSKTDGLARSAPEIKGIMPVNTPSIQNADGRKFDDKRPAKSSNPTAGGTSARSFGPLPTNRTPPSVPTGPFTFETPTPGQRKNSNGKDARVPRIKLENESPPPERLRDIPDSSPKTTTSGVHTHLNFDLDWNARYQQLEKVLLREREGLPSRTIWQDLVQFRWPLSFAIFLAAYSSYAPSLLATITWILFLPCLVAELRSWFPNLALH